MSFEERVIVLDFVALIFLWIFRQSIKIGPFTIPGWSSFFENGYLVNDGTVAIFFALVLFIIPSKSQPGGAILDNAVIRKLPWDIIILFGGGFALASGFIESGLSGWLGERLMHFESVPLLALIAGISLFMTFLTELTSNTATTEMILPVLASRSTAIGVNPILIMVPATLSASFAFMLPVATPPNVIVFATGYVKISDMIKTGIVLNLIGCGLVVATAFLLMKGIWGI
ncbi:MAG: sodium-dependent dicarboxylate transporter 2/3/5 [Candidatus Marinamargulisbacteria bacterium]|jgi:sodium-dependent dicarboxylate transporter 2/3/5